MYPLNRTRFTSRSHLSNEQAWEFGQIQRCSFQAKLVNDQADVSDWQAATVPGNVRVDLLNLGRIVDPISDPADRPSAWVDEVDWWYRTTLAVDLRPEQRCFVRFHGLDYLAAIFIDEQELARHEGMFSLLTLELTDQLRSGSSRLGVRLWGSGALPRRQLSLRQRLWQQFARQLYRSWVGIYPDRTATLKAQFSFGWDFVPPIRTVGIWDEVDWIVTGPTFIEDCRIAVTPTGAGHLCLRLNSRQPLDTIAIELTITPDNFDGQTHTFRFPTAGVKASHQPGQYESTVEFVLPDPKLWFPWDRGYPQLYKLHVRVADADELTTRFGIRTVVWQNWQLKINDQPAFVRGLNWVPADCLPGRVTAADYTELLTLVKETGANLLRVWGGGLREKAAFYDRCDELGLMVWQEFPFACLFLGTFPRDPAFLALVRQEASAIVEQLNHHPALVLWCGGNEFSPRHNRPLIETLAQVVENCGPPDPTVAVPFIPASPQGEEVHNWDVWHGLSPIADYQGDKSRFMSEFGLQALPHQTTLEAILPDPNRGWETRLGAPAKLRRYLAPFLPTDQARASSLDLSNLIEASQQAQAAGLQTAIEHLRRHKAQTGGVILWQFNEPWPAISWAILDYFRRPKLAFHRLKWWYNPVLISLEFRPGRAWQPDDIFEAVIWGINDTDKAVNGSLRIEMDGEPIYEAESITLPADTSVNLGKLSRPLKQKPEKINLVFRHSSNEISQNHYDLDWQDTNSGNLLLRLRRWVAHLALK